MESPRRRRCSASPAWARRPRRGPAQRWPPRWRARPCRRARSCCSPFQQKHPPQRPPQQGHHAAPPTQQHGCGALTAAGRGPLPASWPPVPASSLPSWAASKRPGRAARPGPRRAGTPAPASPCRFRQDAARKCAGCHQSSLQAAGVRVSRAPRTRTPSRQLRVKGASARRPRPREHRSARNGERRQEEKVRDAARAAHGPSEFFSQWLS